MRELSKCFLDDLTAEDGLLHPILERMKRDHTLMLAIRDGYINIYYRGGNLLKLTCNGMAHSYKASFDPEYDKSGQLLRSDLPEAVTRAEDVRIWLDKLPHLKQIMDFFFSDHNKSEREFQQLVVRENNYSRISNETEYFITDIEFADSSIGARFDMLAVRWLVSERKDRRKCRAALIEMKYGDQALDGNDGLLDHLRDIDQLIYDGNRYRFLLNTMEAQFRQLDQLGLLTFNRCKKTTEVKLRVEDKPEVIIVVANHNPRSTRLEGILQELQKEGYGQSPRFELRFFVTSFAGYGLHADNLLPLDEFQQLLRWLHEAGDKRKKEDAAVDLNVRTRSKTEPREVSSYMTGTALVAAYQEGHTFFVGRQGGISGRPIEDDVATGRWRAQRYETDRTVQVAPNRNWFSVDEFARKVGI